MCTKFNVSIVWDCVLIIFAHAWVCGRIVLPMHMWYCNDLLHMQGVCGRTGQPMPIT